VGSFNKNKILFQEALHFQKVIVFYYSKQIIVRMIAWMPPPLTWHIFQIIVDVLSHVMSTCVFNQSKGHWLLSDF
jgi:hypothetical protein